MKAKVIKKGAIVLALTAMLNMTGCSLKNNNNNTNNNNEEIVSTENNNKTDFLYETNNVYTEMVDGVKVRIEIYEAQFENGSSVYEERRYENDNYIGKYFYNRVFTSETDCTTTIIFYNENDEIVSGVVETVKDGYLVSSEPIEVPKKLELNN